MRTAIIVGISIVPCQLKGRLQKFRRGIPWSEELLTTGGAPFTMRGLSIGRGAATIQGEHPMVGMQAS